jgi:hypothetical protein
MKALLLFDRPAEVSAPHACYICGEDLPAVHPQHWGRNSKRPYCSAAHLAKGETYVLERMQELTRRVGV